MANAALWWLTSCVLCDLCVCPFPTLLRPLTSRSFALGLKFQPSHSSTTDNPGSFMLAYHPNPHRVPKLNCSTRTTSLKMWTRRWSRPCESTSLVSSKDRQQRHCEGRWGWVNTYEIPYIYIYTYIYTHIIFWMNIHLYHLSAILVTKIRGFGPVAIYLLQWCWISIGFSTHFLPMRSGLRQKVDFFQNRVKRVKGILDKCHSQSPGWSLASRSQNLMISGVQYFNVHWVRKSVWAQPTVHWCSLKSWTIDFHQWWTIITIIMMNCGWRAKDQTKRWPETQRCADEGSGTDGCLPRGHPGDGDWDGDYATSDFPKGDILMYQVLEAYASFFFFCVLSFLDSCCWVPHANVSHVDDFLMLESIQHWTSCSPEKGCFSSETHI